MSWTINSKTLKSAPATTDSILIQEASGTVKRTTAGNASGNIPLANGAKCENLYTQNSSTLKEQQDITGTQDCLAVMLNYLTQGAGVLCFLTRNTNINAPFYGSADARCVIHGDTAYNTVFATSLVDKRTAVIKAQGGLWQAPWTQLTDASGNAIFPSVATTASAANAYIAGSGNTILRSTSSAKYKTDVRDLGDSDTLDLLRPVLYKSNPDTVPGDDPDKYHYGFIAEDIDKIDTKLVHYIKDDEGNEIPDGVQYERVVVLLVKRIHELEERLAKAGI